MSGLKSQVANAKKKHPKAQKFVPLSLREFRPDLVPEMLRERVEYAPYKPALRYKGKIQSYNAVVLRLLKEGNSRTLKWAASNPEARAIAKKNGIKLAVKKKHSK